MRVNRALWGTALGVFALSAIATLAMMAPPERKNRYVDPQLAEGIAGPAMIVALALGLVLCVLPIPTGPNDALVAVILTATVGPMLAWIVIYRAVVGANDDRGLSEGAVGLWLLGASALLALFAVLGVRAVRAFRGSRRPNRREVRR